MKYLPFLIFTIDNKGRPRKYDLTTKWKAQFIKKLTQQN